MRTDILPSPVPVYIPPVARRDFIIGLTGDRHAGKDSSAAALLRHGYKSIAFADALRAEIAHAWRIDVRLLTDQALKDRPLPSLALGLCTDADFLHWAIAIEESLDTPRSPRWIMQRWGTEFRRTQRPDYWLRIVAEWAIRKFASGFRHLVITDVRMPNEAALVHALGGKLLRVVRPGHHFKAEASTRRHESEEHGQLEVDGLIVNDGGLDYLARHVERVVHELLGAEALPHLQDA